ATGAVVYSVLSVITAVRFLVVAKPAVSAKREPISILKPLAGLDDGLEENLRSFFAQGYSDFELIFAVREPSDRCIPLVERLRGEFNAIPSALIITGEPPYPRAKVYSLSRMMEQARHDLVVMSDSDIRVTPDFLERVGAEFADGPTALATCPYRAIGGTFWSK